VVVAVATGRNALADPVFGLTTLGAVAANCLARAIARGVYEATTLPFPNAMPSWRDRFS
jgi:D-aminopeptidase